MKDLEALESQKSYQEFLRHAMDIRPSERSSQWSEMVADMAIGLIDFKMTRFDFSEQSFEEIEKLALWPNLQNDEFFQTKRANFVRRYFPECLKNIKKSRCADDMTTFWNNSPKDVDLGLELAYIIKENELALDIWPFIRKASTSELSHIYCQKPLVQQTLISELTKPTLATDQKAHKLKRSIDSTLNEKCWKKLKPLFVTQLDSPGSDQLKREAIYKVLKVQDAIDSEDEDFFLISYILQGPIIGETFNLSWARVRELAENYPRRMKLLARFKKEPLLPDGLFASANAKTRDVIMAHIDRFFPEYFPYYAQSCLDYRQGIGHHPRGNPTMHCGDFFKISEKKNWVEQSLKLRFSGQLK